MSRSLVERSSKELRLSILTSALETDILWRAAQARHLNISQFVLQISLDAPAREIPTLYDLFSEQKPAG